MRHIIGASAIEEMWNGSIQSEVGGRRAVGAVLELLGEDAAEEEEDVWWVGGEVSLSLRCCEQGSIPPSQSVRGGKRMLVQRREKDTYHHQTRG